MIHLTIVSSNHLCTSVKRSIEITDNGALSSLDNDTGNHLVEQAVDAAVKLANFRSQVLSGNQVAQVSLECADAICIVNSKKQSLLCDFQSRVSNETS